MVELTEDQKCLIRILKAFHAEPQIIVIVMTFLRTREQMSKLAIFLGKNREATPHEILQKALEIYQESQ